MILSVSKARWGRWKYYDDNGYFKKITQGWVASGGFARASVRACLCVEDMTAGHH